MAPCKRWVRTAILCALMSSYLVVLYSIMALIESEVSSHIPRMPESVEQTLERLVALDNLRALQACSTLLTRSFADQSRHNFSTVTNAVDGIRDRLKVSKA